MAIKMVAAARTIIAGCSPSASISAIAVQVPPGAQPDAQLRLRGKGLPRFGGRGRGDLYVRRRCGCRNG